MKVIILVAEGFELDHELVVAATQEVVEETDSAFGQDVIVVEAHLEDTNEQDVADLPAAFAVEAVVADKSYGL